MKIVQWERSCSMKMEEWIDRQTDMTKLIVAFCSFVDMPKK